MRCGVYAVLPRRERVQCARRATVAFTHWHIWLRTHHFRQPQLVPSQLGDGRNHGPVPGGRRGEGGIACLHTTSLWEQHSSPHKFGQVRVCMLPTALPYMLYPCQCPQVCVCPCLRLQGELQTTDVKAKFVNGKPQAIEARLNLRTQFEWERFIRFMDRWGCWPSHMHICCYIVPLN